MKTLMKNKYLELTNKYGENRILFVAAIGPAAYGVTIPENEIKIMACYIPTEEELYTSFENKEETLDIRSFVTLLKNKNSIIKEMLLSQYQAVNPHYKDLFNQLISNKELLFLLENNNTVLNNFKENIIKIIKNSFGLASQEKEFIEALTSTEKKALEKIFNEFNDASEGNIVISQIVDKYKISRPVFNNLFYKIKEYKIAGIDNRGVKGTYLSFNNIEVLKSLL